MSKLFFLVTCLRLIISIIEKPKAETKTKTGKAKVTKLYSDKAKIEIKARKELIAQREMVSECGSIQDFLKVAWPAKEYTKISNPVETAGASAKSQIGIAERVRNKKTISTFLMFLSSSLIKLRINTARHKIATKRVGKEPAPAPFETCNKKSIKIIKNQSPQVKI